MDEQIRRYGALGEGQIYQMDDGDLLKFGVKRVDAEIYPKKKDDSRRFLRDQLQYYFQETVFSYFNLFLTPLDPLLAPF